MSANPNSATGNGLSRVVQIIFPALAWALSLCVFAQDSAAPAKLSTVEQLIDAGKQANSERQYAQSLKHLREALLKLEPGQDLYSQTLRASLHCQLGAVYIELGRWREADSTLLVCLELARTQRDAQLTGEALVLLGQNAFKQGKFDAANSYLQEAIVLTSEINDLPRLAFAHLWLGAVAALRGNTELAETELLEAVTIARRAGDQATEGRARNILGENARLNGQYAAATTHYHEALAIYESIGNRFGMTMVVHNLGHVASMMGDTEEAKEHYDTSLRMAIEVDAIPAALEILAALAGMAATAGDRDHALELLGVVFDHPASPEEALHMFAEPTLARLKQELADEVIEAGLARGRSQGFENAVESLLKDNSDH